MAKQDTKDGNEALIAFLLYQGYLQLDFSCTAYATNCYLKLGSRAGLVLQGMTMVRSHAVAACVLPSWTMLCHGEEPAKQLSKLI